MIRKFTTLIKVAAGLFLAGTTGFSLVDAANKYPDAPDDAVTCGSVVKLTHVEASAASRNNEQFLLNSEPKNLGSGSGQQIVTVVGGDPSSNNMMWWIRGPHNPEFRKKTNGGTPACQDGTAAPIKCGELIRMTHLETQVNLHSHEVKSPLSRQQEVSGFGQGDGNGDNGDDWKVVCSGGSKYWRREAKVHLQHVDSRKFLGASSTVKFTQQNCGHNCPIMNHLESFSRSSQDKYGEWFVEMGVHIHH